MATDNETYKRGVSFQDDAQWALGGTASTLSGFSTASVDIRDRPKNNLQYIPKREEKSQRPTIAATIGEICCFFRIYTSAIGKAQIVSVDDNEINWFFWFSVMNLMFGSMPRVFIQAFLAAYVPEEHFYLDKMAPVTYGYNFILILAAFFELGLCVNNCSFLLDYLWEGLSKKSPWNICPSRQINLVAIEATYITKCLTLAEFSKEVKEGHARNETLNFHERVYFFGNASDNLNRTYFQMAQVIYYGSRITVKCEIFKNGTFLLYYVVLWCIAAFHSRMFFKKPIWKIDVAFIALSLNAPPLAHVLFSRSTTDHSKIQYNSLSLLLVFSNWLYGLGAAILGTSVKRYCETTLGAEILFTKMNDLHYYYYYPIFFSRLALGNILFTMYTLAIFFGEFYCFIIVYHVLVETIACEWRVATKILTTAGIIIAALIVYILVGYDKQVAIYLSSKCVVICVEIFGIYLLYPLGRLLEDMTFHNGRPTNTLRVWSLRLVPIYVGVKMYTILSDIDELDYIRGNYWIWLITVTPIPLGLIYIVIMHIFIEKRKWTLLFCPEPEWGPTDSVIRYCRKLYKSDQYIGSQADRNLSRYMISKSEAEVYRLDVRYDAPRRSSTPQTTAMRYEDENQKKNV